MLFPSLVDNLPLCPVVSVILSGAEPLVSPCPSSGDDITWMHLSRCFCFFSVNALPLCCTRSCWCCLLTTGCWLRAVSPSTHNAVFGSQCRCNFSGRAFWWPSACSEQRLSRRCHLLSCDLCAVIPSLSPKLPEWLRIAQWILSQQRRLNSFF